MKLYQENNENKQKEAGTGPFFKKGVFSCKRTKMELIHSALIRDC